MSFDEVLLLEVNVWCLIHCDPQAASHLQIPRRLHFVGEIRPVLDLIEVIHGQFAVTSFVQTAQEPDEVLVRPSSPVWNSCGKKERNQTHHCQTLPHHHRSSTDAAASEC